MLGNTIKKIRENKHLGLNETARLAGISGSYLSNIEKGIRENPSIESLQKIADALGVSVNEFFEDENSKESNKDTKDNEVTKDKDIDTIAAHLEGKNLTPQKIKLLEQYIDALFDDEDFDD